MGEDDTDNDRFPPLAPTGETPAPADPAFVKACLAKLAVINPLWNVERRAQSLTQSPQWGLVLRVDFTLGYEYDPRFINRFVCWKAPDGKIGNVFAIGQQMPALDGGRE